MDQMPTRDQLLLERIHRLIEDNIDNHEFGVKEFAKGIGLSRSQLHRKISELTGKSPNHLIRETRLKKAKMLLENKSGNISEIADKVGFGSPSYFSVCFNQHFGYPPTELKFRNLPPPKLLKRPPKNAFLYLGSIIVLTTFLFIYARYSEGSKNSKSRDNIGLSIGVTEFEFIGKDNTDGVHARGIKKAIVSKLINIGSLSVSDLPNTLESYSLSPRELSKRYNFDYLLDGSFQMVGDEVFLTIQLLDARTGNIVKGMSFKEKWQDILIVQNKVALAISKEIVINISTDDEESILGQETKNSKAYEFYLVGQDFVFRGLSLENLLNAEHMFKNAVEVDSTYTLAWAGLASASRYIYFNYITSSEQLEKTWQYLKKAIELDEHRKEVQYELAMFHFQCYLNYDKALGILQGLYEKYPRYSLNVGTMGWVYRRMDQLEKSIEMTKIASSLDPTFWVHKSILAETYQMAGNYDVAKAYYDSSLYLFPSVGYNYTYLAGLYLLKGEVDSARNIYIKNLQKKSIRFLWGKSEIECLSGNIDNAIKILKEIPAEILSYHFYYKPKELQLALYYSIDSDSVAAKTYFETSRIILTDSLRKYPDDCRIYSSLALSYAGLGQEDKALANMESAMAIVSMKNDVLRGFYRDLDCAKVYLLLGQYEKCIQKLDFLISHSGLISKALISIDPFWNPLKNMESYQSMMNNTNNKPFNHEL